MKKNSKFARYGGIFFVILFVLITFVINTGILYPKYETMLNTTTFPVVYSKDNTLFIAPLDKTANSLSDFLTVEANVLPVVEIADSGNAVYFFENYDDTTKTGSLFVTYDGKEKIPVSGKAYKQLYISANGKAMLYAENPDLQTGVGKLVLWEKGGKKTEISQRVKLKGFGMDKVKNHIFYIEYAENSDSGDLYIKKTEAEKIDSEVFGIEGILDGNSLVYLKRQSDTSYAMYYWENSKQPQKLSDDMLDFAASKLDSGRFMWCTRAEEGAELISYDPRQSITLDTGVANILESDPSRNSVLYTKNFSPETYEYDVNLIYKGGESEKIASSKGNMLSVTSSVDFKKTAYIDDGKLYIKEKGWRAEREPVVVAENASSFELSPDGNSIAFVVDNQLFLKYKETVSAVAENVAGYHFTPDGNSLCYVANYNEVKKSGNLFVKPAKKPNSEAVKVDSDVMHSYHARDGKHLIYIKNYNNETGEGELCVSRNGKIQTIDSGKIKILCEKY